MGFKNPRVVKSGQVVVSYSIVQFDDIDGSPAFDFRTDANISSGAWFPSAEHAERELFHALGMRHNQRPPANRE